MVFAYQTSQVTKEQYLPPVFKGEKVDTVISKSTSYRFANLSKGQKAFHSHSLSSPNVTYQ
jgi:hypothetical protein